MRLRSKPTGALTRRQKQSAVREGSVRSGRLTSDRGTASSSDERPTKTSRVVTGAQRSGQRISGTAQAWRSKAAAGGQLDGDDQVRSTASRAVRRSATSVAGRLPAARRLMSHRGRGGAAGRGASAFTSSGVGGIQTSGQIDSDQATAQLVEQVSESGAWGATKLAARGTVATARGAQRVAAAATPIVNDVGAVAIKGVYVAGRAGGRLTVGAVKSGGRLTSRAGRRVGRRAARTARTVGTSAAGFAQRSVAAAQTAIRAATIAVRSLATALLSAVSSSGVLPAILAILAVVALLVAILPGFITGAGKQQQESTAIAGVCKNATFDLGPVKPHVQAAAELIGSIFGVDSIGGWRAGNTFDYEGHPAGLAIDVMVPVNAEGHAKGQKMAEWGQEHAADLGIKYIIWDQKIWSVGRASEGWRPMEDRGSISANHKDHNHISFNPTPGSGALDELLAEACGAGGDTQTSVAGDWAAPVKVMRVSSPYGMRRHPVTGIYKLHTGTDYPGNGCGTPIYAAAAGSVKITYPSWSGVLVAIDHGGGVVTQYGHMYGNDIVVKSGDHVVAGQQIGLMGTNGWSTGCHLHFEVKVNGGFVNPANFLADKGIGNA